MKNRYTKILTPRVWGSRTLKTSQNHDFSLKFPCFQFFHFFQNFCKNLFKITISSPGDLTRHFRPPEIIFLQIWPKKVEILIIFEKVRQKVTCLELKVMYVCKKTSKNHQNDWNWVFLTLESKSTRKMLQISIIIIEKGWNYVRHTSKTLFENELFTFNMTKWHVEITVRIKGMSFFYTNDLILLIFLLSGVVVCM